MLAHRRGIDVVCGVAGHAVVLRQAAPIRQEARWLAQQRTAHAQAHGARPPASRRGSEACASAAASWAPPWRGMVKADGMAAGDTPPFVVPALEAPPPPRVYADLSCARGHGDNASTAVQHDRHSDRPSATTVLAHAMRLVLACAASVLHHARRPYTLAHTPLAPAPPSTLILPLFKVATPGTQDQDRRLLPLPSSCPVQALLHRGTALLSVGPLPGRNTS